MLKQVSKQLRRLRYAVFAKIPRDLRFEAYRFFVEFPTSLPEGLTIEVAKTQSDLEQAFRLLHDEYVRMGFMEKQDSGIRVLIQHALPTTSTLVAKMNGQVVGSISMTRDNPIGLPMEKVFNVSSLRKFGARLVEISSLVVAPEFRRHKQIPKSKHKQPSGIVMGLFGYMSLYAKHFFGADYIVMNVYPHHTDFYEALFGCKILSGEENKMYCGAPATAIYFELANYENFALNYSQHEKRLAYYYYINQQNNPHYVFPDRSIKKIHDPVMTPEMLQYFFREKSNLFSKLSDREYKTLLLYYRTPEYRNVIGVDKGRTEYYRASLRIDCNLDARVKYSSQTNGTFNTKILDLSRDGFMAQIGELLPPDQNEVHLDIALSPFDVAQLEASVAWRDQDLIGFAIRKATPNWFQFVEMLEQDLNKRAA